MAEPTLKHLIATVVIGLLLPCLLHSSKMGLALSEFQRMAPDNGPRVQASLLEYALWVTPGWEWLQLYRRNGRDGRQPWVTSALLSSAL